MLFSAQNELRNEEVAIIVALEDEFHVVCVCPEYNKARNALLNGTSTGIALNCMRDVVHLLSDVDHTSFLLLPGS